MKLRTNIGTLQAFKSMAQRGQLLQLFVKDTESGQVARLGTIPQGTEIRMDGPNWACGVIRIRERIIVKEA